jgi:hypothetical protein
MPPPCWRTLPLEIRHQILRLAEYHNPLGKDELFMMYKTHWKRVALDSKSLEKFEELVRGRHKEMLKQLWLHIGLPVYD